MGQPGILLSVVTSCSAPLSHAALARRSRVQLSRAALGGLLSRTALARRSARCFRVPLLRAALAPHVVFPRAGFS